MTAPPDFTSGLRNIRHAIEARLRDIGMQTMSLRDSSMACARPIPGMVMIDVGGAERSARVTFTRDEVEDCCRCVETHCVRSKIDRLVIDLMR